jgi:hypothetical protein
MNKELYKKIVRIILVDIIWEIVYFPIWWYSQGLSTVFNFLVRQSKQDWRNKGLSIGFKFLFKPMYSQNDFVGRAISFFVRLFVLIFKIIVFLVFFIIYLALLILWILLPYIVLRGIFINYKFVK